MHGCVFHWAQAVYRKVQELGLSTAYHKGGSVSRFVRRILSLPFLPAEHIEPSFKALREKATDTTLQSLMNYVGDTWLNSSVWDLNSISCFMRSVRTNNDVQGWHRRLNTRAGRASLHFYSLLWMLHQEAELVSLQVRLVSEGKLRRHQKKKTRQLEGKLFSLWEGYREGSISASKLLKKCGRVYSPV